MHVGMSTFFQNPGGKFTDRDLYQHELSMADLAEPLGFDSIWTAEHHFTDYTMCPNTTQFLTYMAGRTKKALLGQMVVVLPWHDPVRVAEEVAVLDHMSNGRVIFGMGRGLGRVEFDAFRLDMGESRERFVEYSEAIVNALESGYIEYDGKHLRQPRAAIRPKPFKTFHGRTYAAAVSPESSRIMARLGVGILIIPQKPWDLAVKELNDYRDIFEEMNGTPPPPPIIASWVFCDESEERALEMMHNYIIGYTRSALDHYEFANRGLADIKGYEYYGKLADRINKDGVDNFVEFLAKLQIYGTPEQCYEKIIKHRDLVDSNGFIGVFSYGGMPFEEGKRNIHLFAKKVLPELHKFDAGPPIEASPVHLVAAQ